ncbi:loganic acid O-methyltransferase-like isoform X1 [Cornus florida]|uniref:loganic acid O-methyltransferase-like isoform X1 n=1 Tax=Cornus florida TaxID=4283 RepID=UPI00289F0057|nr:loganic acid O-methyltransferase-like isoform X1 [Cornus florida]
MSNTKTAARPESYPMTSGDGTYSYSNNSIYQREGSDSTKELINEAISEKLDIKSLTSTSSTLRVADLGCSVGPNTFFAMQNVLQAMEKKYHSQGLAPKMLEFQVFFNDHASNDFNTLFASLPFDRQYFAAGVPGSFYGRLFPDSSLHFLFSCYALHWLSKVPEELLDKNSPAWNKGNIHYTRASEEVAKSYGAQFAKDMEIFLNARAKETVIGGMMVLIMPGLPNDIHHSQLLSGLTLDFLGSCLMYMVNEGLVCDDQVDSFNLPMYFPTPKEMAQLVEKDGRFSIQRMELMEHSSKINAPVDGQTLILHLRASMEGIFTKHFGHDIVDKMFEQAFKKTAELSCVLESTNTIKAKLFLVLMRK